MRPYVSTKNVPKNGHICSRLSIFIASNVWPGVILFNSIIKQRWKKNHILKDDIKPCNTIHRFTKKIPYSKQYLHAA